MYGGNYHAGNYYGGNQYKNVFIQTITIVKKSFGNIVMLTKARFSILRSRGVRGAVVLPTNSDRIKL